MVAGAIFLASTAVRYKDDNVLLSPYQPDLWNTGAPVTLAASETVVEERRVRQEQEMELENSVEEDSTTSSASKKRKRPPRLSMFEVSEIAVSKGIQAYTDLLALAPRQKREGKIDLAEFIVN